MRIRPAGPGDAMRLAEIWEPVIRETTSSFSAIERTPEDVAAQIAARQGAGRAYLVAEAGGVVGGFATYDQFRPNDGYRHSMEHTVMLAPEARGQGMGRALMAAIEEHAAARGAHVMIAAVDAANTAGIAFHAALGYAETGRMPQVGTKFGRWLDLVLMQKIIGSQDSGPAAG